MAILMVVVFFARNWIAVEILQRAATYGLGSKVSIGQISIGWNTIQIGDVRILELDAPDDTQIAINRIVVAPTIGQGIQKGVWCRDVLIDGTTLHLRFDSAGKLISKFPSSESESAGPGVIPFQLLTVSNSKLIVDQDGKQPLQLSLDRLEVRSGSQITIAAETMDLLGGQLTVRSVLDSDTFAGRTRFDAAGIRLNTDRLSSWPLMPAVICTEAVSAVASVSAEIIHPANDLNLINHSVSLAAKLYAIDSNISGDISREVNLSIAQQQGVVDARVFGNVFDGQCEISLDMNLNDRPMTMRVNGSVRDLEIHRIAKLATVPEGISLPNFSLLANADVRSTVRHSSESTHFDVAVFSQTLGMSIDGVPLKDSTAEVHSHGVWAPQSIEPLVGNVSGTFDWNGLAIADLMSRFDSRLPTSPSRATGAIVANGDFDLPLATINDPGTWQVDSRLQASNVNACDLSLDDTALEFFVTDGRAMLTLPATRLVDLTNGRTATFSGSVNTGFASDARLVATGSASRISTEVIARLLGVNDRPVAGDVSATGQASVPMENINDIRAWTAGATLNGDGITAMDEQVQDFEVVCQLHQGRLTVPETAIRWRESICKFGLDGMVSETPNLTGQFHAASINMADVSSLARRLLETDFTAGGVAEVDGQVKLQGNPTTLVAVGKASLQGGKISATEIGDVSVGWRVDDNVASVTSESADFFGGRYSVSAAADVLDLDRSFVHGAFANIQARRLLEISGVRNLAANGVIDGEFRFDSPTQINEIFGTASVTTSGLTIDGMPAEISAANLQVERGLVSATLKGHFCDGSIDASARAQLDQVQKFLEDGDRPIREIPVLANARLDQLLIERLVHHRGLRKSLASLGGSISGRLTRDLGTIQSGLLCKCSGTTENITWDRSRISERVTADVLIGQDRVIVQELRGRIADGQLSGRADITLQNVPQGSFRINASNMSLRRGLAPFLDSPVFGTGQVTASGRIGRTITGHVDVRADNARFADLAIQQVRIPVDWSFSPSSGAARWKSRSATIKVGTGNVFCDTEGSYAHGLSMNSTARLDKIDTARLIVGKSFGMGIMDGTVSLQSKRASKLNQVSGRYDISLTQTKALEMPVLNKLPQLVKLPKMGGNAGSQDHGYLFGHLSGGVVYLEQMALHQSNVQLLMDGTATLDGRLAIDVIASTESSGPIDDIIELADSPLLLAAPAPVALLAKANDLLKNRVIQAQVSGTANRPVIRLQPGKQLTQTAIQFFIADNFGSKAASISAIRPATRR